MGIALLHVIEKAKFFGTKVIVVNFTNPHTLSYLNLPPVPVLSSEDVRPELGEGRAGTHQVVLKVYRCNLREKCHSGLNLKENRSLVYYYR